MDDKEFCLNLIRSVKKRPCLYNSNMVEYTMKDLVEKVWRDVGEELEMDAIKCKEKWRNIKTVLKRHLTKGVIKRRRKYYLFDQLRFVIPYMGVNNPETYDGTITSTNKFERIKEDGVDTDPSLEETVKIIISTEEPEDVQYSTHMKTCNNSSLVDHTYNGDSVVENQYNYQAPLHTELNSRKRKMTEEVHEAKQAYYVEVNNNRKKEEEDAKKAFLMSLLPDLNLMDSQQTRYFKKYVLEVVEEILDGNISNIRSQKYC